MKNFKDIEKLKQKWNTTEELFELLEKKGYPHNVFWLRSMEKQGKIPLPKRENVRGLKWRVYDKEGEDFKKILDNLKKLTRKVISNK